MLLNLRRELNPRCVNNQTTKLFSVSFVKSSCSKSGIVVIFSGLEIQLIELIKLGKSGYLGLNVYLLFQICSTFDPY